MTLDLDAKYKKIIGAALSDLDAARQEMQEQTIVRTGDPRPRVFEIAPGITWPCRWEESPYNPYGWNMSRVTAPFLHGSCYVDSTDVPYYIIAACLHRPRRILRALRRIQAATAWCRARTEGRKRQAEEILRQQAAAVEELEAEAAMLALR